MSLIEKKLKQLQPGTNVEITRKDENRSKFIGLISDNDFEESLELTGNFGELILMYSEVSSFVVIQGEKNPPQNGSSNAGVRSQVTVPVQPQNVPIKIENLSFYTSIEYPSLSDADLDAYLKNNLSVYERKLAVNMYQSFKYKLKNREKSGCISAINRMLNDFDYAEEQITTDAYRFILALQVKTQCELSYDCMLYIESYDYLSVYWWLRKDLSKSVAYACIALLKGFDESFKNILYTIIAQGISEQFDASGLAFLLSANSQILLDQNMLELLKFVYAKNQKQMPQNLHKTLIISDLNDFYKNNALEGIIRLNLQSMAGINAGQTHASSSATQSFVPVSSIDADNPITETKKGEIYYISWGDERGKIASGEEEYSFDYTDIVDRNLLNKLKAISTRELRAINSVFQVEFTVCNDKVSAIKEIFTPGLNATKTTPSKTSTSDFTNESSLRRARRILATAGNEHRFVDSLPWLENALTEEDDPMIPLSEYINCCIAIANRNKDESYILKAYEAYVKYKEFAEKSTGVSGNVAILDLLIKMKKTDEAISTAGRILADPKITVEIRLHYIFARARLLAERAASMEESGSYTPEEVATAYESAKTALMDWEQRYLSAPSFKYDSNKKKMYYNIVLLEIAKCLIKTCEAEKAEDILKRIKSFDPSNENAKSLLQELISARKENSAPQEDTSETELTVEEDFFDDFYDDTDEEQLQLEEYKDVSGWDALALSEQEIIDYSIDLIAKGHQAVAVAYLKAASSINDNLTSFYNAVSYATNHPLESLNYRLDNVALQYNADSSPTTPFLKYAQAAAVMRGSYYHSADNDYFVASAYLDKTVVSLHPALSKVFEYIESFRSSSGKGMDLYADYRYRSDASKESMNMQLSSEAQKLYERYFGRLFHENVAQRRFKITKTIVFEKDGFIEKILKCVVENDATQFKTMQDTFVSLFIRSGSSVSVDNIDGSKIEAYIDEAWAKAGKDKSIHERKTSTLMGSLRNNLRIPISRIVELVCSWLTMNTQANASYSETELALYRSMRADLLNALELLNSDLAHFDSCDDIQTQAGVAILQSTTNEIHERISGIWSDEKRRYYFADFLQSGNVLLNDNFLPDLTFTFCDLPTFNLLARIRTHIENNNEGIVSYAQTLYSREADKHDFGTAEKIVEYLNFLGREAEWKMPENADAFDDQAKKQLRDCYDKFNVELYSAFTNGRIKLSDAFLQSVGDTAQSVYQYCFETHNYGFFFRFIAACQNMIHDNALEYGAVLETQLEHLASDAEMDKATYQKISGYIETQQFTVAEEMMDRYSKGNIDDDDIPQDTNGYLVQFWDEFESNYTAIAKDRGKSLARIISSHSAQKDRRGGEALVNSWPRGDSCSPEQIKMLLRLLGWSDIEVDKSNIGGNLVSFSVKENVRIFSQREYAHPIAAFGTQAYNDGFYVVCLFGTTDSARLIDICKRLDSVTGNKILLVDFALSAGERRRLARLMKQVPFANTYLFVDRVSLLYLANHYVGGVGDANNRALFAISMPFTYYQPYDGKGSSSATAPELFSGRKDELLSVELPQGANLIYGGRQLGKTAILKKAVNETHDPENGRYAFAIDIKEKNCQEAALKVSRWLSAEGIFTEEQVTDDWEMVAFFLRKNIIDKSISYILLMLDEADSFIEDCRSIEYAPFVALKDIQQSMNGKFKFVLAGLHNIVKFKREVALGHNSVIAHLSALNVKPFDYATAKLLLREPLSYLGFDFDDDEVSFMQICSATNYYPGLLQFFCQKLIESLKVNYGGYNELDAPGYKVTTAHISKVLADKEFLAAIKEKFEITLRLDEGNYYYMIALLLAMLYNENESAEGYDIDAIIKMAEDVGVDSLKKLTREHLSAILDELCDLNILKMIDSGYAFRTRSFRDLLGSKTELEDQLLNMIAT